MIHLFENAPADALAEWLGEPHPLGLVSESVRPSPLGYRSPELAGLLRALDLEFDLAAREDFYHRINEILRRDAPVTFLFPVVEPHVTHRRIRGFRPGKYLVGYPEGAMDRGAAVMLSRSLA
jgi:ABC-type transport system substrate-binding protein